MHRVFASPPAFEKSDGRGTIRAWYPARHVCATRVEGHLSLAITDALMEAVAPAVPHGLYAVHDWSAMTGFDALAPPRLVAWAVSLKPRPKRVVIAANVPLVVMAVRAANLTMKNVEIVASAEALGPMLDAALSAPKR